MQPVHFWLIKCKQTEEAACHFFAGSHYESAEEEKERETFITMNPLITSYSYPSQQDPVNLIFI